MASRRNPDSSKIASGYIQFNALGLALFSATLILVTGFVTASLFQPRQTLAPPATAASVVTKPNTKPAGAAPVWGELICYDINLAQPDEYLGYELDAANREPRWTFPDLNREAARQIMLVSGLTPELAARAVSNTLSETNNGTTIVHPDNRLLTALSPDVRAKLYGKLARTPGNPYMAYPFCFPRNTFAEWFGDGTNDTRAMTLVRSLLYPRGDGLCFSDIEFLMNQTPSEKERMDILRSLSRQSAVLVRVRIRPDADIDKLLSYWSRGIPVKDLRPLLESISRLPDGGTVSLLHFLPKFARERLYTFPMPSQPGDPVMDCHWSTMNFFNETPDNRFTGTTNTVPFLQANYDQIGKPGLYGDVILILNDAGKPIHSVVYIADDIIFTKNGYNCAQPWMLMRLDDLLARYTANAPPKTLVYRKRKS